MVEALIMMLDEVLTSQRTKISEDLFTRASRTLKEEREKLCGPITIAFPVKKERTFSTLPSFAELSSQPSTSKHSLGS